MIQTLPRRCRYNNKHIVSQVRAGYDRQCTECDDPIERGEDCLMVYETNSDGTPNADSGRLMHARHLKEYCGQIGSATARQMLGEF